MALTAQRPIIRSSLFLKVTAFIIGYSIWATLANAQIQQVQQNVPLAFYNVPENWRIESAESIEVTLMAKRAHLATISPEKLTVHIDAATLKEGENRIDLCDASLFLPKQIEIVDYAHPLIIQVHAQAL